MHSPSKPPRAALALIGFTAIIAQIVLMRELIVVFSGNEISLGLILASWLLWTAFGSGVLGRVAIRTQNPCRLMAGLQASLAVVLPGTILAVRASRAVFQPTGGQVLGPGPALLTSLVVLTLFCSISGWLFAVGSRVYAESAGARTMESTSSVYLLEAVGSGAGGLLASLLLIRYLGALDIALLLSFANCASALSLAVENKSRRYIAAGTILVCFVVISLPNVRSKLERVSQGWLWRGSQIASTRNSIYGDLTVTQTSNTRTLFENGLMVFSAPDPAAAEEAVHFALLQHPAPKNLLLIGGGINGSIAQALQHASLKHVDYVELDPAIFDLARDYFPVEWASIRSDPRVQLHPMDGRLFLKTTQRTFDVIVLNLPDPQTAQLNRLYTAEFFQEVAAKLAPEGVFSFQVRAAEDFISPELADFLRCLRKTLREIFPEVTFIPGETAHFFAAKRAGLLAAGSEDLVARLRLRHLQTAYVREYYIPFRMMPDRMADFDAQTRPQADTPTNHDFVPIAYFFDTVLWSKKFNPDFRRAFQTAASVQFGSVASIGFGFLALLAAALHWRVSPRRRQALAAGACVAATGFTLMGLEILLLLGFQAIYGYVYYQLSVLIAAFMAGMALGSWSALRRLARDSLREQPAGKSPTLARIQILVGVAPLLLYVVFFWFGRIGNSAATFLVSQLAFPALAVLCGWTGGLQFPVASRVYFALSKHSVDGSGTLYALDLVGACVGAILLSIYCIPVFGFLRATLLIAFVNLVPATLAFFAASSKTPPVG